MKKIFLLTLFTVLLGMLTACGQTKRGMSQNELQAALNNGGVAEQTVVETREYDDKLVHNVEISVKDYGIIIVKVDGNYAPVTVDNFIKLINDGFYDGLTFHRIIEGFMMQGGDPTGTGSGGSDTNIKGEFTDNGVNNPLSHTRGAISMARARANDSASSQFFIVQADSTYLDGQYACFGYVTEGMDVVDAVCKEAIVVDNNGTVLPENQPVIEYIKVID